MISICIVLIVGASTVNLPIDRFTLAWTHSIEKVRWEEDYVLRRQQLAPVAGRMQGNGAGMEIPAGAQLRNGVWHYVPQLEPVPVLRLARSAYVPDYEICWDASCQRIAQIVPSSNIDDPLEIRSCE